MPLTGITTVTLACEPLLMQLPVVADAGGGEAAAGGTGARHM